MTRLPLAKARIRGGYPLLSLVCLIVFVDSIGYGVVVPVLPLYAKQLGVSDFKIGFLFATYAIALLVSAIPMGMLSDRIGRKPFVLFGMFAMAGAFVFYALARTYAVLVVARVLDGLTAAATWSAGLALIGDRLEGKDIGQKFGFAMAAAAVGAVAGPLIGGVMSDLAGYRSPYYLIAGICLAGGVTALFLEKDTPSKRHATTSFRDLLLPVLKNRIVLLACLIATITTFGFGLLEPILPLHLNTLFKMSELGIGLIFGITMALLGLASPLVGRLSDRVGRKLPIVIGLAATAVVTPAIAVARNLALVCILMGLIGITVAFFETPSFPLVIDTLQTGEEGGARYGTAFGLLNLFWSLGYALGPIIGGAIMQASGLLAALLMDAAILVVLTVLVQWLL